MAAEPCPEGFRFIALNTFDCEEIKSTYIKDFGYEVRAGNDLLARLAAGWLANGFIEEHGSPKIVGEGTVSWQ